MSATVSQGFAAVYPMHVGGSVWAAYAAVYALFANFVVAIVLTPVFDWLRIPRRSAAVSDSDYDERGLEITPITGH